MEDFLYLCDVLEDLFEHDVNDPGRPSPKRMENASDTLSLHLRQALRSFKLMFNPKFLNFLILEFFNF